MTLVAVTLSPNAGKFCIIVLSSDDFFLKINFFNNKKIRNTARVSNSLVQMRARQNFVGPDLGPKCLQRLSADDTSRRRVK